MKKYETIRITRPGTFIAGCNFLNFRTGEQKHIDKPFYTIVREIS